MKTSLLARALFVAAMLLSTVSVRAADTAAVSEKPTAEKPVAESSAAAHPLAPALQPFVDSHSLAGAVVAVADKKKILDLEAVGMADIAANRPMTTDSIFWIASQSKPITATALMMLVDEGKVNVDDPVEKYLPEFKDQKVKVEQAGQPAELVKPKHPILVRNVLSHTSGLPFKSAIEQPTLDQGSLADRVRSYAAEPLLFEPDSKYQYSNEGINTAGRIIEVVSGMPYEEFLNTRLLEPLGMKDTTFWPNAEQIARIAKPYKPTGDNAGLEETDVDQLKYPLDDKTRQPMPAGGLFSTATDVARFCQMILNNGQFEDQRYLSKAAVKQMTHKQTGDLNDKYGFGWSTGHGQTGHGGAFATNMTVDRKNGLVLVYLIQHKGFPGNGKDAHGAFENAARQAFAKPEK